MGHIDDIDRQCEGHARQFIDCIQRGVIRKRTLPNSAGEYSIKRALESFEAASGSDWLEEVMQEAYNGKKK